MTVSVVELQPYNPDWEQQFEWEKKRICDAIDGVIEVEHIGSTSIKGLTAKPIIDIMAGVPNLEQVDKWVPTLMEIEYEYVPKPEFTDRKFFRKGPWGQGICHLHICEYGSTEWRDKLLFRNYLRQHSQALREYASLKEELAHIHKFDRHAYTDRKGPFIRKIIELAATKD
ncbi:GrpB family protein [Niallia taxi]|uniref:GrpB family protein n=1 Tax=Niallia TaxID=2837506 RepID=UPI002041D70B|nr:GrpB family protein [Niallia sp. MER 6]MCM3032366.1 GrpB family protein [Niallia sp. MER 6]